MTKTYYGANSVMGKNFSYDSECWLAYSFDTEEARKLDSQKA